MEYRFENQPRLPHNENVSAQNLFSPVRFIDKLLFTKHLSVLLKSGIPLSESLEILESQARNPSFKKILHGLSDSIRNGVSLEKSLDHYPRVFDPLYRSVIGIGEDSGTLETNLEYLAKELGKAYEFKKRVQGAMLYPTLVLGTSIVVGGFVAVFILPQLVDLFTSLDTELPPATKILLFIAKMMQDYGILLLAGFAGLIALISYVIHSPFGKPVWHRVMLKLPIFGVFMANVQVANFCRSLGLMLRSGLPITPALASCAQAAENLVFKGYIHRLQKAVDHGQPLEKELASGAYPHMPYLATRMIGVGERTGKLDETLLYLSDFFEEEVDDITKNLSTILEPILLFGIAAIVLFIAIAIITPIYNITASVKK